MKFILSISSAVLILMSCSKSPNNNGASTTTVIPLAPSNLTGVLVSSSQVNLTWTDNSTNETGFKIERRLDGGNFAVVGTVNADVLNFSDVGLAANTNYTYRVESFNAVGSSLTYSNEWSINTGGTIPTGSTVTICNQIWSTKNLDVSTYRNGDAIPQVTDPTAWANLTTGAWCYYNNDAANGPIYGKLYNWYAVNDVRGLAPTGYHVPSDAEWTTLETCLGGSSVAGGAMKEAGLMHWLSPNTGATNSSGFAGLPGGYRYYNGPFYDIGYGGYWWSSTEGSAAPGAWFRSLAYGSSDVSRDYGSKADGFSVRCLRD
jgi:uncharacterized protein (TIGR02145 family)